MTFKYNISEWAAHDPDGLLALSNEHEIEQKVNPREDLIGFENNKSGIIVDVGFYGNEATMVGDWVVYVIGKAGWDEPLVRKQYKTLIEALKDTESILNKYKA